MKEYVYFDRQLVNSTLAQIDEGILTKLISGQTTTKSNQEDGGEEISRGGNGKISMKLLSGGSNYSKTEIDKFSSVYSMSNNELIETALDDYSLDVLLEKLKKSNLLKNNDEDLSDGDFFLYSDKFDVFNFDQLKSSVSRENLDNILIPTEEVDRARVELDKLMKNSKSRINNKKRINFLKSYLNEHDPHINFGHTLRFANYASVLFPNTTLFRISKFLAFGNSDALRINLSLLAFLSQTKRKITILGIVTAKRDKTLAPDEGIQLSSDVITSTAPAILTDILLESFNIVEIDNYFVRPIAIYF
ncbi:hypothetical protein IGK80_000870 [Enterococcus sp. DIV0609]|uniref:DUF6414 family protein n=1 Tax=Enterococcus TaxID=1350 RepID=UPI00051D25D0|nr:hypothetical protein [Enterococcus faecalis]EGO5085547.1 hypothetical protein [Enterococcus faecalis]EGO6687217.1 hypothetical protein [Enterococcus faecalis]EGO7793979.1 hypothetical protein [Enterococcus faecalis]EGO9069421.1 hypothetical protein [Enterococcus faecalis]EIB6810873.1 hypothetical protein [Enterococcus faecalis]